MDNPETLIIRANVRADLWKRRAENAEKALAELQKEALFWNVRISAEDPTDLLVQQNESLLGANIGLAERLRVSIAQKEPLERLRACLDVKLIRRAAALLDSAWGYVAKDREFTVRELLQMAANIEDRQRTIESQQNSARGK